jgi:hypothetical protein
MQPGAPTEPPFGAPLAERGLPMRHVFAFAVVLCACGGPRLIAASGDVQAAPAAIDFGPVVVGATATQALTLHNSSPSTRTVHVSAPAPFALDVMVEVPGGAMVDVGLTFAPISEGTASGAAKVVTDSGATEVALSGQGVPAPLCSPPDDCHGCDGAPLPDGTACTGGSVCLAGGGCVAGACIGTPVSCDDGNACTLDVCVAVTGCQHVDSSAQCPAPADPCQAAVCDAKTGCGAVVVADGTSCGPGDCTTAHVCLSGQCQVVAVPEGHACSPTSPCRGAGVCHQGSCDAPPATVLQEAWHYTPAGNVEALLFEGVTDAAGNLYWLECEVTQAKAHICALVSYSPQGQQRFRNPGLLASGTLPVRQLISGDRFIMATPDGQLVAASTSTGAQVWQQQLGALEGAAQLRAAAVDDARVWATLDVYSEDHPFTEVVIVNAVTGALVNWVTTVLSPLEHGLVLDEAGNAFTLGDDAGTPQLVSLSTAGAARFSAPFDGTPRSLFNGEIVSDPSSVRSTIDGALLAPAVTAWWPAPQQTPLMSLGARWMLGSANACAWCQTCDCTTNLPELSIRSYTAGSAAPRFDHLLTWDREFTDGVLLSDSSVLFAGRTNPLPATLIQVDAQGNEVFVCDLPDPAMASGLTYTYSGAVALTQNQWAVLRQVGCDSCFVNPPPDLVVFPVPGLVEASSGWTGRYGGPSRANRPH